MGCCFGKAVGDYDGESESSDYDDEMSEQNGSVRVEKSGKGAVNRTGRPASRQDRGHSALSGGVNNRQRNKEFSARIRQANQRVAQKGLYTKRRKGVGKLGKGGNAREGGLGADGQSTARRHRFHDDDKLARVYRSEPAALAVLRAHPRKASQSRDATPRGPEEEATDLEERRQSVAEKQRQATDLKIHEMCRRYSLEDMSPHFQELDQKTS